MTLDSRLRSNIISLYLVQGLQYLVTFITTPFLNEMLHDKAVGVMAAALSGIQYGVLLTDFGFNLSATRAMALVRDDPAAVARVFWRTTWIKLILMVISLLALLFAIWLIPEWRRDAPAYLVSFLYIASSVLYPIWYFQGFEELRKSSFLMVVMRILMLGFLFWKVRTPEDILWAIALQAAPQLLAGIYWWATGWGLPRPKLTSTTRVEICRSLRESWPFFLSSLSINLYTTSTTVILNLMAADAQVGYFSQANKLTYTVQGLIGPLVQATYPRIAQLAAYNKAGALALIRRALLMQGGMGLGMTLVLGLGAFFWAPLYLRMPGASLPLMLLSPVVLFGALSYVYGLQTLLAFGYEGYYSRVLISAGLLNVALLVGLLNLPYADKASLAAITVTLVEVYIVAAFWWRARKIHQEIAA